jgi:predicted RND superfamily exporter protein
MFRFSIRHLAAFVTRYPNWCLAFAIALTVASLFSIQRLTIEMDISQLLPEGSDVARITRLARADIGSFDFMVVVLEASEAGQEEALKEAAAEVAIALDDRRFIRRVAYRVSGDTLEVGTPEGDARAVALLTDEDRIKLEQRLSPEGLVQAMDSLEQRIRALSQGERLENADDPLDISSVLFERLRLMSGPLKVNIRDNYFISEDGQMLLVLVRPVRPASDLEFARYFQSFLEGTRRGIYIREPRWDPESSVPGPKIDIRFFGSHYETIADQRVIRQDFFRTSIASLLAVLALFFFAFRRPEALIFVGIPLSIGMIWTLGLMGVLIGRITQVTMIFSAILIGQGIDFSVHVYNRYLEEVRQGRENTASVRTALAETGPATIAGALTTAIGFFGMMTTQFQGFRELGMVVGMGVLCSMFAMILLLPPILIHFGSGPVGVFTQRPMSSLGLRRFYFLATAYPRATVLAGLLICAYMGYHARFVQFNDDFDSLKQPSDEYVALRERIGSHFSVPGNQVLAIVTGPTEQAALEENDRLFRNILFAEQVYPIIAKDSLRYFFPSESTQRRQLDWMSAQDLSATRQRVEQLAADRGLSPQIFQGFFQRITEFQSAAREALTRDRMPVTLDELDLERNSALRDLTQRYMFKTDDNRWRIVTLIYPPPTAEWQRSIPQPFRDQLSSGMFGPVEVTGVPIIQEELRRTLVKDLARSTFIITALIMVYLVLHFENTWRAFLAILPVMLAVLCMMGTVYLFDMQLHYLNIICIPMVIGIGVDSAVHLLHRYYEEERRDLRLAVTRTGRAIMITSMTTLFAFGSLALANFRGIRELGIFAIIGVTYALFASILILPAIIKLTEGRTRFEGGPGDDVG